MSLSRQLLLLVLGLYVAVFTGNFYLTVDNTRRYAANQLESHALDTATSLGLSLSPHLADGDVLLMESMVDAIFDRGYYRRIVVLDTTGAALIDRHVALVINDVPDWFVRWLAIEVPPGEAVVMSGWQPGGTVRVVSHPGFAYTELWGSAVETLGWSLVTLVVALLFTAIGLRMALRPLNDLEAAALAVAERIFKPISPVPKARELRRVVEAMNQMTEKVEVMVSEQHSSTERQRRDAYIDPVTGLGNRSSFERELSRMVSREDESVFGSVLLCQLSGLDDLNRTAGYERGDAMLRSAAAAFTENTRKGEGFVARLGGGLFGMVLPGSARAEQDQLLETVHKSVREAMATEGYSPRIETGAAYYGGSQGAATLMQRAQAALHAVAGEPEARAVRLHEATETLDGEDHAQQKSWRTILESVIERRAVVFRYQAAVNLVDGNVLHNEVLARLDTGGERLVEPGMFMPMAVRVNMAAELDRTIIEMATATLDSNPTVRLSINLARETVLDENFGRWLSGFLARCGKAHQLLFEVQERVFALQPDAVVSLSARVREGGGALLLDRCGANGLEIDHLRDLRATCHKIDGQFVRGVDASVAQQRYVESMLRMRHSLDLQVIAERVETEPEMQTLRTLGFDGVQGFYLGAPAEQAQ